MKRVTAAGVEDNNMKGRKALAQRVVLNYNKTTIPITLFVSKWSQSHDQNALR